MFAKAIMWSPIQIQVKRDRANGVRAWDFDASGRRRRRNCYDIVSRRRPGLSGPRGCAGGCGSCISNLIREGSSMATLSLPTANGQLVPYEVRNAPLRAPDRGSAPRFNRIAYAAAHVVVDA